MKIDDPQINVLILEYDEDFLICRGRISHPITEEELEKREKLIRDYLTIPGKQIQTMIENGNYVVSAKTLKRQRSDLNFCFNEDVPAIESLEKGFYILKPSIEGREFAKHWILEEARLLKEKLKKWRNRDEQSRRETASSL